jgi:flagellar export protein FliJ
MAFRLDRVLRLRAQLRARAQDDVARAGDALAAVHHALDATRGAADAAHAAETAVAGVGVPAAEFLRFRTFAAAMRARQERLERERGRLVQALIECRQRVIVRRREERQIELLRERAEERESARAEHVAAVLLDDLARRRRHERR